jgi:SulP family sulfate permease
VVLTAVAIVLGLDIRTVGDMGELPDSLPVFLLPTCRSTWKRWDHLPYSLTLMVVGLLESLMTATIVDDLTDTKATRTANASARAWPTSPRASSAAWRAAR